MIAASPLDQPDLQFLGRVAGVEVRGGRFTTLKRDGLPTAVYRAELLPGQGDPICLIIKVVEREWQGDEQGHLREVHFYRHIAPKLALDGPQVLYAGPEPSGERQVIVMADYGRTHRFLPAMHAWTMAEFEPALRAYARLHAGSQAVPLTPAEQAPLITRLEGRVRESVVQLPGLVAEMIEMGVWPELPGFERALAGFLDGMPAFEELPASVLHLDFTPGNVGLPLNGSDTAIIVDWEMAGYGLPETDLSYAFIQPYGNARLLERECVLARYWRAQVELGRDAPPPDVQRERLHFAERLWALWLIPVARRVANQPFAPESAPAIYWDRMFPLLGRRLLEFAQGR